MASKQRNAKRESGWREVVARQVASGLSVRAFCRREGRAESNFYAWRWELPLRDREAVGARSKPAAAFVPVVVTNKQSLRAGSRKSGRLPKEPAAFVTRLNKVRDYQRQTRRCARV